MSVIFCDDCDSLVDTDYFPEFEWDSKTDRFTCESCLESREESESKNRSAWEDWNSERIYQQSL